MLPKEQFCGMEAEVFPTDVPSTSGFDNQGYPKNSETFACNFGQEPSCHLKVASVSLKMTEKFCPFSQRILIY
jgi:hypothetical protein